MIATAGAALMLLLSVFQEVLVRTRMRRANQKNMQNQRLVDASLRNAEVINGMGMIKNISNRFEQENREVILDQTVSSRYAGGIQSIIKPMQNVLQILIYGSGAYFVMTEGFSVGLMVAAAIIMGRALAPLMQVMSAWKFTLQARDAYHRLESFLEAMEKRPQQMRMPAPQGRLSVKQAALRLQDSLLLRNISFELSPGDFLGLIGPSGAGKTTLCRLILGIWPSMGGKIRLDGMDIHYWDQEAIGGSIGYLPQEVELFPGTVAQNISRMGPVEAKHVQEVAQACGIHDFIQQLPHGYATMLEGPGGLTLSGGQKQRLGLARALYNQPRLVVLDEPNSNLDEQGEQDLLAALKALKATNQCTCIMVTHKPQLLNSMDKIMMLKNGQVSMFGPREQVFSRLMQQPKTPAKRQMQVIRPE
jgi:PrtD family type I secretion system ABC transporter